MEEISLQAQLREELGKSKMGAVRRNGFIPAVIYSENKKSEALKVLRSDIIHLVHGHRLENNIIKLKIIRGKETDKERPVLIKEIQRHPVSGEIIHLDFNQISLTKKIHVKVPIIAKGEATGVKQDGGVLQHIMWEVEVECLPTNIPKGVEVDVTNLKIGDAIHVKDVTFPESAKVITSPDSIVLSVTSPVKVEEILQPAAVEGEEAQAEPEVIKEKKKEEGAEAEVKDEKAAPAEKAAKESKKEKE